MARSRKQGGVAALVRGAGRPTPREAATAAVLLLVIALVTWRVAGLVGEFREVRAARATLEEKRGELEERHRDLERQAQFVADPDNLEQELRTRYNYKYPSEQVIVVVPPKATGTDE